MYDYSSNRETRSILKTSAFDKSMLSVLQLQIKVVFLSKLPNVDNIKKKKKVISKLYIMNHVYKSKCNLPIRVINDEIGTSSSFWQETCGITLLNTNAFVHMTFLKDKLTCCLTMSNVDSRLTTSHN